MPTDDTTDRAEALRAMQKAEQDDPLGCGPEPTRPTYYSTQADRDRWIQWNLCRSGVKESS